MEYANRQHDSGKRSAKHPKEEGIYGLLYNEKKVRKVKILNPIILGREFKDKDIILDIRR